jgi:hypothetical protein
MVRRRNAARAPHRVVVSRHAQRNAKRKSVAVAAVRHLRLRHLRRLARCWQVSRNLVLHCEAFQL